MKKTRIIIFAVVLCLTMCLFQTISFAASTPYTVTVYDTDGEGLALRKSYDSNSERLCTVPDGAALTIAQISYSGWGYTEYNGYDGWVDLEWTKVSGSCSADQPSSGYTAPIYYVVYGTDGEGLELRVSPSISSSTYGAIPNGAVVVVNAISGDWAYTSYNGNSGWANLAHLTTTAFAASIYGTANEGLALKASADINSQRYLYIPEGTNVTINYTTTTGWGYTSYGGYSGWVSLQYVKVSGSYQADAPSSGYITPAFYIVLNTDNEGLELRTKASINSCTFGYIPTGTTVLAEAICGDWAYVSYNGHKGWANTTYLASTAASVTVYDTANEGLALKASADGSSQRYCLIPEGTQLNISKISNGWGYTTYNGQSGWVAVRYTRIRYYAEPIAPTYGFITSKTYTVVNAPDGLELRASSDGENISYATVPNGTSLTVTAIENNWGYTSYNGYSGWVLMTYLQ